MKKSIIMIAMACCMAMNFVFPAFAVTPPPGYSQVTEAGGTGSTNVSIQIEGSGNGGGGGEGEEPGGPGGGGGSGDNKPDETLYSYLIQYHYDESVEREAGQGKLYDRIPYDMETPKAYAGHNWVLERFSVSKFIVADESMNTAELWYTMDDKDSDGNEVPGGDGIPDKYQDPDDPADPAETFKYSVAYNYEDEAVGQIIEGAGTVGSVIPYSSPNTTTYNNKLFQLSKVAAKSNIITPDEGKNKVDIDYNTLKEADKDNVPSDNDSELYVTFDPANGEKIVTRQVTYGTAVAMPEVPVKSGCKFLYWGVAEGGSYKEFDFNTLITSNTALVAQYELEAGMVAYKVLHYQEQAGAEGTFPGYRLAAEETLLGSVSAEVTAIAKNYVGYKEDMSNADRVASGTLTAGSELVLRLFYAKDVVTVTIDPDNGTDTTSSEIPTGSMISVPPEPVKPDFKFAGWTMNGEPADFSKPIVEDMVIKAVWDGSLDIIVENYAEPSGAAWNAPANGWTAGANTFTVSCGSACAVVRVRDSELTVLSCEQQEDGTYAFTTDLKDNDRIIIVLVGDVNMDGRLTLADLVRLSQYHGGKYTLPEYGELAADMNVDGQVTLSDLTRLSQYHGGKYTPQWMITEPAP